MSKETASSSVSASWYRRYLLVLTVYYMSDLLWGFLSDAGITPLVYADTVIYFISMALSVLLWSRFVTEYIGRKGIRSTLLRTGVIMYFAFVIIVIIINVFRPVVFSFSGSNEYVPTLGRYIVFGLQFLLFVILAVYCLIESFKTEDSDRTHYRTVSASTACMAVFTLMQVMFPLLPFFAIASLVSTSLIHVFVEVDEKIARDREMQTALMKAEREQKKTEKARKERETYNNIAESLAEDYDAIYYIEIETGNYREFSASQLYETLKVPKMCKDFYGETRSNVQTYVHPDDREFAKSLYYKDEMLKQLEGKRSYSYKYRVMVNGQPRYFRFSVILTKDKKHFVLYEKDIDDEITAETMRHETQKKHITYGQIAESIASNYDVIYYVDIADMNYVGFTSRNIYGQLVVDRSGYDFFGDAQNNAKHLVHPQDGDKVMSFLNKDYLLSSLEDRKQIDLKYRIIVDESIQHTRLSARITSDREHFIICVENIEAEVQKEKEHMLALNTEKELARRDELTGTKNKTAYSELEKSVQGNIDNGMDYLPFAIAVCDINDLKKVNDSKGHKAGDDHIKSAAKLLCDIFDHSPVFRIGGDEFVIFLRGSDYTERDELIARLRETVLANLVDGKGPIIATGISEYNPESDHSVSDVFNRADNMMYEDKRRIKGSSLRWS
ncbi:MAG: diguanylate cyclase [Lachnospiraceae bacterium]|nr:diguanylate cyclase [Lachnospiraceae bacterium]